MLVKPSTWKGGLMNIILGKVVHSQVPAYHGNWFITNFFLRDLRRIYIHLLQHETQICFENLSGLNELARHFFCRVYTYRKTKALRPRDNGGVHTNYFPIRIYHWPTRVSQG